MQSLGAAQLWNLNLRSVRCDTFTCDAPAAHACGVPLPAGSEPNWPLAAEATGLRRLRASVPPETTDAWTANSTLALQAQHANVREFLQAQRDRWRQIAARFTRQIESLQAEVHALQA